MKLRLGLSLIFGLLIASFMQACSRPLPPQESCNFVQNSELQRVSWKNNVPVKLYLHNSVPTEAYAAIDRAIMEFNTRLGGGREVFKIVGRGATGEADAKKDGFSVIYWLKTWDPKKPTEQARTTIYWAGSQIFEADLRINASTFEYYFGSDTSFSSVDLDSLLVHELGHILGLAHSPKEGSVMNATLNHGQVRRTLDDKDLQSLNCEYKAR